MGCQSPKILAADCVVFDGNGKLLLIKRRNPPFQGMYALPGGFVEPDETVEEAAIRELREETGIVGRDPHLVGVYSEPGRDPRGRVVSIAYLFTVPVQEPTAQDDAAGAGFIGDLRGIQLAFDHDRIVRDAMKLLKA